MILRPATVDELRRLLAHANEHGEKISGCDLGALSRVLNYTPEDMTATVEAGLTLAAFQQTLARHRQWLPVDPPHPECLSLGTLLATNPSGPRRFGHGTIRDHLLGLTVALADGRIIKSGGQVVKNVAGYDLQKLFVGSRASLGIILAATFKLLPQPAAAAFVQTPCANWERAGELLEAALAGEFTPVVLDLHRPANAGSPSPIRLVLGFAGTAAEVAWQLAEARKLGVNEPATLAYEETFWNASPPVRMLSVLPSNLIETLRQLDPRPFVARAGNGIIYHHGEPPPRREPPNAKLSQRVKDAFDPNHIFPDLDS